jgi:hypothetical protein
MDYEVEPRRVASPRRPAVAVMGAVLGALGILAAGLAGGLGEPPPMPTAAPPPHRIAIVVPATPATTPWPGGRRTPVLLARPRAVDCTTVGVSDCVDALEAARRVVVSPGAVPAAAVIHASLICGSYRDCPRWLISEAQPLGSVVIRFDDGRETWVNVVRPTIGRPEALVVRWIFW